MSKEQTQLATRTIETEIKVDAPVEAVWKALTDAEELTRWFPLEARVTPGPGGSVWANYGGSFQGEARIEIWEPNRHLRLVEPLPSSPDAGPEDKASTETHNSNSNQTAAVPLQLATDYYLEGDGGRTILRLVHSGFEANAVWDNLFEATRLGWKAQFWGLRHYLERHRGTPRAVAQMQIKLGDTPIKEAWDRLMSARGLGVEGAVGRARDGERYKVRTGAGDVLEGIIAGFEPPVHFNATIENLNDAYLMIHICPPLFPDGQNEIFFWLSTWGVPQSEVGSFRDRWAGVLEKLFPEDSESH